ncbi:MAG TPA: hypothetical protein VIH61_00720 [Waddliaceae bacterium]
MNNQDIASRKEVFKNLKRHGYPLLDKQWNKLNCMEGAGTDLLVDVVRNYRIVCIVSASIIGIPAIVGTGVCVVASIKKKQYLKKEMTAEQVAALRTRTKQKLDVTIQAYETARNQQQENSLQSRQEKLQRLSQLLA